jgi:hypothetical protein
MTKKENKSKIDEIIERIQERKRVTQALIYELNTIWNPIVKAMDAEDINYSFKNGFSISTYLHSSNYGTWFDLCYGNTCLPGKNDTPNKSGYWCDNFNYEFIMMNKETIIELANDTIEMIKELHCFLNIEIRGLNEVIIKIKGAKNA